MPIFNPHNNLLEKYKDEFFAYLKENQLDQARILLESLAKQDDSLAQDICYRYLDLFLRVQHDNLFKDESSDESNIVNLEKDIDNYILAYAQEAHLYLFYFLKARLYLSTMRIKEAIDPLKKYAELAKETQDFQEAQRMISDCYGYLGMKEERDQHIKLADEKFRILDDLDNEYRELELDPLKKMELAKVALKILDIDPTSRKAFDLLSKETIVLDRYNLRLSNLNSEAKAFATIIIDLKAKIEKIKSVEITTKTQQRQLLELENELLSMSNLVSINQESSQEIINEMGTTEDVVEFLSSHFQLEDND